MKKFLLLSLGISCPLLAQNGDIPSPTNSAWQPFVMIGIALVFFYFILWRPEQKRRKALDAQRSSLKKGDRVVVAGILGEVHQVQEKTVIVKLIDNAKMEVMKGAIIEVHSQGE